MEWRWGAYASKQSQIRRSQYQSLLSEYLASVRVIYFADSCQVFLYQVYKDMLYKSKEDEFANTMMTYGVATSAASLASTSAAAKGGVDRAKQPGACKYWHDHPRSSMNFGVKHDLPKTSSTSGLSVALYTLIGSALADLWSDR